MYVRPAIAALRPLLSHWRREFHQFPELSFREVRTSKTVCQRLSQWGWQVETVAGTGVIAVLPGSDAAGVLAFRADMDALAIQEQNLVPYRSQQDGVMHACGHDGHTAILLGLAKLLASTPPLGTVKLLFQPAEEGPGGALPMIAAGALENPRPQAVIGLHLWNNLPLGTLGLQAGPVMAQADHFNIKILGRGGHGAIPQQTVDAIVVASQVVTMLQTIVSRNVDPLESAVISVGRFEAGRAFNVIAQEAQLEGTVRCFSQELAKLLPERLEAVVKGVCQALGASYELDYKRGYPPVVNDPSVTALVQAAAPSALKLIGHQTLGGEDISYFLNEIPGCYFFLGSANLELGLNKPHHHPCFDFDEQALGIGVEVFARVTEQFFGA
jgi:amidohydrolase